MEKISIIVPIYNSEKTLEKCINTLINQTYKNIELILVNDGSTDNSLTIINKFKTKYNNKIIIINQKNMGIGAARNNGINISTGDLLGFVDSDDFVEPTMFETLYNNMKKNDSDISVCDYYKYNCNFTKIVKVGDDADYKGRLLDNPKLINIIDFSPWNKLYKKELFVNNKFPTNLKYEDLSTILKTFFLAKKISKVSIPLYYYYINENGETKTINERNYDCLEILKELMTFVKSKIKNESDTYIELEKLSISILYYAMNNTFPISNNKKIKDFINESFGYLDSNFAGWKKRNFKSDRIISRIIKTNRNLLYLYHFCIKQSKKRKKIIFFINNMEIGGIETSMISMLNKFDYSKFEITLVLQNETGELLKEIPSTVNIKYSLLFPMKNKFLNKINNRISIILFAIINYRKYDFSANYCGYGEKNSILALLCSKNNAIWLHGDYTQMYDSIKLKEFIKKIKLFKFKKIIFVSNDSMIKLCNIYPKIANKCLKISNIIDYKKIIGKSNEIIDLNLEYSNRKKVLFVGRFEEETKQISKLIKCMGRLKQDNAKFVLWLVGDGKDLEMYKKLVNKMHLEKDILFFGKQNNPFPFYKACDCVVLSSCCEGNPVIFSEAKVMNKPIITTNVSDALIEVDKKYGIVCKKNDEYSFYKTIKTYFDKKFIIKEKFDVEKSNTISYNLIEEIINKGV